MRPGCFWTHQIARASVIKALTKESILGRESHDESHVAWEESLQSPPVEDGGSLPEPSGEAVLVRCPWCCHGCQLLSFMARKPTTRGKGFQSGSIVPDYQTVVALPPACARPGTLPVHLICRWRSEGVWSHCGVSIIPGYSRWPSSSASHLSPAPGMSLGKGTAWCWTPDFIPPHTHTAGLGG